MKSLVVNLYEQFICLRNRWHFHYCGINIMVHDFPQIIWFSKNKNHLYWALRETCQFSHSHSIPHHFVCLCVYIYVCVSVCICIYICVHVYCVYKCVYVCACVYIYCVYVCVLCTCVCVSVWYLYVYRCCILIYTFIREREKVGQREHTAGKEN